MTNTFKCVLILTFLLQTSKCVRKDIDGFVVGGQLVDISKNPHSVFLDAHCNVFWICGSALLNQRIIITVAHCIVGCERDGHYIQVSAGSRNLREVRFKRFVKRYVVHENFNETWLENDIGLALLNEDIPLGKNVKRVIIRNRFPYNTYFGNVAGWGTVDEATGVTSTMLKEVSQKLRSRITCAKIGRIKPGMFCAGSDNAYDEHPAKGDSGAALVTRNFNAIGLVSFNTPAFPALTVYTNITFYYDWVTKNAKDIYCNYVTTLGRPKPSSG